ncbi:DNA processing protein [Cryobacterium mesophilum]|uniref:DNA-protecting protein DprA n=1 Tax=Terrimesophilobacter mesophilus TaxID=433647 RepID=A0A4R8V846_9MICO|nr:DNA-processing protein DprA [Terrimesophilobacter mesophilus]MBB5632485.1 DNA processing protein [Terrimesophilobacter mesophilus]TFB79311.1 DNA-protecting protein DprA [Terrimesophilobacter mesophilus]
MSILGLKESQVAPLVRAIAGDEQDRDALWDRFSRSAWTGIAEPGDRVAGTLVAVLGAREALDAVVSRENVEALHGRVGDTVTKEELGQAFERWTPRLQSRTALLALSQAARYGVRLLVPGDTAWPPGMDDLGPHAPLALWLRGNESTLATAGDSIALVGARAATGYGEHVAMEASAGLVDRGYTIVSGAAYGIDGMAHRAALASSGQTIAVLAGGVDRFYPSGHEALLTRIVDAGAVLSELPCGAAPTKWRFLQRNRLIAAMSRATVVLEAGWRSGSLNTAGHAAALGRPLGAVPGPVTSAASAGCHRLIREFDAVCVTNPDEMAELAPLTGLADRAEGALRTTIEGETVEPAGMQEDRVRVVDALSTRSARVVDDIAARAGLSVATVQGVLGAMQLDGGAAERGSGWVRTPPPARG